MGYYEDSPPRHGHRNPIELAEDEMLSAFHGRFCGMPATADQIGPCGSESPSAAHRGLLRWVDANPLASFGPGAKR